MSIRIRFDAQLSTHSDKGIFPKDTIAAVYVTNRDGCTHACAPVSKEGFLSVDFIMAVKPDAPKHVRLTERAKFHFYFRDDQDGMLKPVCAGHMTLVELADRVKDGAVHEVHSNFNSNTVRMQFQANAEHSRAMHLDLLSLYNANAVAPSALSSGAERHLEGIRKLDESVRSGLQEHTLVTSENGGNMFHSIFTAHVMENEATAYTLYHLDFHEPEAVPPWLCTYLLAETLHTNAVTPEQVKAMPLKELTNFISSYAQAPMRSASAVPYTPDLTLNDDPQQYVRQKRTMLSEVFKRPFSLPHAVMEGYGTLQTDDCEGLVVTIRNLTNHLGYLHTTYAEDFRKPDAYLPYNSLMRRYFPKDLFGGMTAQYQNKLMDMALFLGERVAQRVIECKVTLAAANGASMGGEGRAPSGQIEIQAHACASMVCNDPNCHHVVMLEGTACATDDQDPPRMRLGNEMVSLADVANTLSYTAPFNRFTQAGLKSKVALHLTHSHGDFYRAAFCQDDAMLGSQIGQRKLTFGVDMEYLSDETVKVYMPVTGKALPQGELDWLKQYVQERRAEIHPPLVDHDELRATMNWTPIEGFRGCKELQPGRPFTTCLVHVLANKEFTTQKLLELASAEAEKFNAGPNNSKIGVMRAFASMDGVTKVLHLYTDDTEELRSRLSPERAPDPASAGPQDGSPAATMARKQQQQNPAAAATATSVQ